MELITNGYFDSGELAPWEPCSGMVLEGGGVTDRHPVFLSLFNLRLRGNDCVRQRLDVSAVVPEGSLAMWVCLGDTDISGGINAAAVGSFEARVEYTDGGDADATVVTWSTLRDRRHSMNPYNVRVAVDPTRIVRAVRLRCIDTLVSWYVCAVTMDGHHTMRGPREMKMESVHERLARMERKLMHLERAAVTGFRDPPKPPPVKAEPGAKPRPRSRV